MSLGPIESVQGVSGTGDLGTTKPAATGGDFAAALTGAVDDLQSLQSASKEMAIAAVTGNLDDIHKATLASTRAQVTFELVATVRNKGIDAFNEIMRMQA